MEGEGMVAVVRGLRDSGLAVTLMDGSRQYTLMPNAGKNPSPREHVTHGEQADLPPPRRLLGHQETGGDQPGRCESAAQATDGRYASMYKMAHCSVTPTSPPVQLTEFPPQKAELCPGQGNFEVGGCGSGENYVSSRSNGSFRGGMSWPDRGSVCSPRPSREPDAFANSLRKYPNVSLERSTEMVERLITYTQAKNLTKAYQGRYPSPLRHGVDAAYSSQLVLDRSTSRNTVPRVPYQRTYESEARTRPRMEESPTRDTRADCDCEFRRMMSADGTCLGRKPYSQQGNPILRERYEYKNSGANTPSVLTATNSVNMEVQASTEMVSREVATVPSVMEPTRKTVAVPLSRNPSSDDQKREGEVSQLSTSSTLSHKSVDTSSVKQTTSCDIGKFGPVNPRFNIDNKSKSKDKSNVKDLRDEILELLNRVSVCPNTDPQACDLRRKVLEEMSKKLQKLTETNGVANDGFERMKDEIGNMLKYVPIWVPCGNVESYRNAISDEIISKMNYYKDSSEVYRAETEIKMKTERDQLEDLLRNIIGSMPVNTMDIFGKPIEKKQIVETYTKRVKRIINNISNKADINILKAEILVVISKIPIAISICNKVAYLNMLVDKLMNQLEKDYLNNSSLEINNTESVRQNKKVDTRLKTYIQPTEQELKEYLSDEINIFLEKYNLPVDSSKDIETELIDTLIDSIQDIRQGKDDDLDNEIILLLLQTIDNLPEDEAKIFTDKILCNVRKIFNPDSKGGVNFNDNPNLYCDAPSNGSTSFQRHDIDVKHSLDSVNMSEAHMNADSIGNYKTEVTNEIEAWLENLPVKIFDSHDYNSKKIVVNDLAEDIVDRFKYLELNPSCKGTAEDELEQLKYQIFKWINKIAGEGSMRTIEHAADLMTRIQSIRTPMFTELQQASFLSKNSKNNTPYSARKNTSQILLSTNKSNFRLSLNSPLTNKTENESSICCSTNHIKPSSPSMKQLNEEYDEFLKKWVQNIPIPSNTSKEKIAAEKARLGIYNGIWKAITKLKFEPATFHNPFYYEDVLDDEIEELFEMLPKSPELETKRHLLKVQLIEKTTNTNELIKSTAAPSSFKHQLVESVHKSLPQENNVDAGESEDIKKSYEELQIVKLVEDFILCTKYKEEDKAKAHFYRKKLIKEVQTLIEGIKKTHGKELHNIDTDLYITSVLNALQRVPLPDPEIIQDEAAEIILGNEVEQWFTDLPLVEVNDGTEQIQRKRMKEALVKKVIEIEKDVNILDCTGEKVLKNEVSLFLGNVPLEEGAEENISFMAEEFANRIKNRARSQNNTARKSVAFMNSVGYLEFSRQMPQCSSFSRIPGARPAVRDQSSYLIREGSIVKDPSLGAQFYGGKPLMNAYQTEESFKEPPSDEFFTMVDSQATNQDIRPKFQTPDNVDWQSIPMATASHIQQGSRVRQQSPCCRNATSPQRHTLPNSNNSPSPARRASGFTEQYNQEFPAPMPNLPVQSQSPCCRNQGYTNGNRVGSPIREQSPVPMQSVVYPDDMRSPPRSVDRRDSYRADERSIHERNREISVQGISALGVPINTSYGEPQGFSTPQQVITQGLPPRPGRKRIRNSRRYRRDFARRRLELNDDSDDAIDSGDEPCPCERIYRYRRRPVCYAYEDYDMDDAQCYPVPYGYPCLY